MRSSARRIIPTSSSIESGFGRGRTARSSMPRIRRNDIRIFIRSILRTAEWHALWVELKDVFHFWIEQGVRIFRVDNPHTKPFAFWEWVIGEIKEQYPDVLFLAEAFTRPARDVPACQTWLFPVLHLFRVAQHQSRS